MSSDLVTPQRSTAHSTSGRLDPQLCAAFCDAFSALLDLLGAGAIAHDIARQVTRVKELADGSEIDIAFASDRMTANDTLIEDRAHTLQRMLSEHGVRSLHIERMVEKRDLLQLAALLHGPVRPQGPSFAELWQRMGVWRIRAQFLSSTAIDVGVSAATPDRTPARMRLAEAIAANDPRGAFSVLHAALLAERDTASGEPSSPAGGFDTLATPDALRVVARLVSMGESVADPTDPLRELLARTGEAGANALFAMLSAAPSAAERRVVFDALVALGVHAPRFIGSLRHPQWYVVRNAAALIGALRMTEATEPLVQILIHSDVRVRLAVIDALGLLGTSLAKQALLLAMNDGVSDVRHAALQTLERLDVAIPSATVVAALDREDRAEVQIDLLRALYDSTDKETHQALIRFCARSLARGGSVLPSLAAMEVLARHRPSSIGTFLRHLEHHDDADVRSRVERVRDLMQQSSDAA